MQIAEQIENAVVDGSLLDEPHLGLDAVARAGGRPTVGPAPFGAAM